MKMSKFMDDFQDQMKDIKDVKKATKKVLEKGGKIAFDEIHGVSNLERLKKKIREVN